MAQDDSWATDGHKWLNVPYDCGYAFVADSKAHRASMSHRASYLTHAEKARDQIDWTPEWSHRGRGVATYAAIRQLGKQGVAELIERTCHHAQSLVTRIGALPGAELVWEPQINQGLVRFMVYKNKMNSQTMIKFMQRLIKGSSKKIFLIVDNLKVHHSYIVRDWLEEHEDEIEIFFLPSYSPELNPDEYLNCDLKDGVHSGVPARTKKELKGKAISHLRKLQKMPGRVKKYFKHPKIAYAA